MGIAFFCWRDGETIGHAGLSPSLSYLSQPTLRAFILFNIFFLVILILI